ncbi:MAG: hypothetical protein M1820_002241 [Bogoriella megaspora]|nr:MAG: hypothetical protein M1820_002241 [Bogoriella megaspora]
MKPTQRVAKAQTKRRSIRMDSDPLRGTSESAVLNSQGDFLDSILDLDSIAFDWNYNPPFMGSPISDYPLNLEETAMVELVPDAFAYCKNQLEGYPEAFARFGSNSFIHRKLYIDEMPSVIRHAFMVCGLYTTKSKLNEAMIYQTLDAEVAGLLDVDTSQWTFEDALAHVQALILYQVIRLFDGDIRQRAFAEQHESILTSWTDQLRICLEQFESSSLYPSVHDNNSSWRRWMLLESARRTILISLFVRGFYHALKTRFCSTIVALSELPMSTRGVLWELESPTRWQLALKAEEPRLMPHKDFPVRFENGDLDNAHIGEYEKFLVVACKGEDWVERKLHNLDI